jgi:hypothetical protein
MKRLPFVCFLCVTIPKTTGHIQSDVSGQIQTIDTAVSITNAELGRQIVQLKGELIPTHRATTKGELIPTHRATAKEPLAPTHRATAKVELISTAIAIPSIQSRTKIAGASTLDGLVKDTSKSNAVFDSQIITLKAALQLQLKHHVRKHTASFLPNTLEGMLAFERNAAELRQRITQAPTSFAPTRRPTSLPTPISTMNKAYKPVGYAEHQARAAHVEDETAATEREQNRLAQREGLTKKEKKAELQAYQAHTAFGTAAIKSAEDMAAKLNPTPVRHMYCSRGEAIVCDPDSSRCEVHHITLHLYCKCLHGFVPDPADVLHCTVTSEAPSYSPTNTPSILPPHSTPPPPRGVDGGSMDGVERSNTPAVGSAAWMRMQAGSGFSAAMHEAVEEVNMLQVQQLNQI